MAVVVEDQLDEGPVWVVEDDAVVVDLTYLVSVEVAADDGFVEGVGGGHEGPFLLV